jgi:membrane-bound metal-dependent hydrolase YbcI (DUF457 family)
MGPQHRVAAAAAWLATATHLGVGGWQLAAGTVIAGAAGHGILSPDVDQRGLLADVIPGGHRGITHWWLIPVAMWWAAGHAHTYRWAVLAVAIAWASHIAADAIFGAVPLTPQLRGGWVHAGIRLRTGGFTERWVARWVLLAIVVWLTGAQVMHAVTTAERADPTREPIPSAMSAAAAQAHQVGPATAAGERRP